MSRILYPLAVDLRGKPVLVAGGGPVAARKLAELLRCGADITVLAPDAALVFGKWELTREKDKPWGLFW